MSGTPLNSEPQSALLNDMRESKGSPLDLSQQQIRDLRTLFANPDVGLWYFCREVFGFKDMIWEFHGEPCQLVGHWGESHLADGRIIYKTPQGGYEEDNVVASFRRIMMRVPRETFKTSCFTRAGALYRVVKTEAEATIGIFNETEDKPMQWIDAIRQVVENSLMFQTLYRDLIPKGIGYWDRDKGIASSRKLKWGATGLLFERASHGISELTIEPHGIGGTAVGKHFTDMIWDDIIGLKAQRSPAVMEAAFEWVDNSRPLERPAEGGNVLVPHTTWSYHDVYKHMEEKWPGEWVIFQRALLEHPETGEPDIVNGVSTFPTKISTKKAKAMAERDIFVFSSQYQCVPMAGKAQSFNPEWDGAFHIQYEGSGREPIIQIDQTGGFDTFNGLIFDTDMSNPPDYAPSHVPLSWCAKSIILDPAPSKGNEVRQNRHARNGLVVCAMDPWGRWFFLDSRVSNETPEVILDLVIQLAKQWEAWNWSVEEVVFSAIYQPLWTAIMNLRPDYRALQPQWFPVSPKGRDKEARIRNNLIPSHELGLVHYNMGQPGSQDSGYPTGYLKKEKMEFPHGQTVDVLDAASYLPEAVQKPRTPDAIHAAWWRAKNEDRGVTGYGRQTYETI